MDIFISENEATQEYIELLESNGYTVWVNYKIEETIYYEPPPIVNKKHDRSWKKKYY